MYYYRARHYDPKIGRFLQPDPLDTVMVILIRQYFPNNRIGALLFQHLLQNPQTISNVYSYVVNNPINWI
ncbi:MAG: RHS repeat-associated core domain-containing protein, partial [Candidatus Heimdallarchaeota archaeon]